MAAYPVHQKQLADARVCDFTKGAADCTSPWALGAAGSFLWPYGSTDLVHSMNDRSSRNGLWQAETA